MKCKPAIMLVGPRGEKLVKAQMRNTYETKMFDINKEIIERECNRSLLLIKRNINEVKKSLRDIKTISGYCGEAWGASPKSKPPGKNINKWCPSAKMNFSKEELHLRNQSPNEEIAHDAEEHKKELHGMSILNEKLCSLPSDTRQGAYTLKKVHYDSNAFTLHLSENAYATGNPAIRHGDHLKGHSKNSKNEKEIDSDSESTCSSSDSSDWRSRPFSDSEKDATPKKKLIGKNKSHCNSGQHTEAIVSREEQFGLRQEGLENGSKGERLQHSSMLSWENPRRSSDSGTKSAEFAKNLKDRQFRPVSENLFYRRHLTLCSTNTDSKNDCYKSQRCFSAVQLNPGDDGVEEQNKSSLDDGSRRFKQLINKQSNGKVFASVAGKSNSGTRIVNFPQTDNHTKLKQKSPVLRDENMNKRPKTAITLQFNDALLKPEFSKPLIIGSSPWQNNASLGLRRLSSESPAVIFGTRDSVKARVVMSKSAIQRSLHQLVLEYNRPRTVNHLEKQKQKLLQTKVSDFVAILETDNLV